MRKVIVVYDDSKKPDAAIRSITGGKSFGNTIFKRNPLSKHMEEIAMSNSSVSAFVLADDASYLSETENKGLGVVCFYSSFIISNANEFKILVEKAVYAHENYRVMCNGKTACFVFSDVSAYLAWDRTYESSCAEIACNAFTDISEVNNFRQFITSGFEARFFNSVLGDEYTVVKRSSNINKIKAEHDFYYLLPDSMKQWFVRPFDLVVGNDGASYKMERFHMADLAIRYVHEAISLEEFSDILDKLFYFIGSRVAKNVSKEEYEQMAENLYITKVVKRTELLKSKPEFEKLEILIKNLTPYNGIDEIIADYRKEYTKIRSAKSFKNVLVVGHGDLCFSNILYSSEASLMKLIDPKGAVSEENIYMDPYYDMAKLSHSICGRYDFFNSDLYEITLDENFKAKLILDFDNNEYVRLFRKKLADNSVDFRLVRIYECSLFLSMLPLHIDRPKKVFAFLLNAIQILNELKNM